jgi:DNA polymerase III subunit beta
MDIKIEAKTLKEMLSVVGNALNKSSDKEILKHLIFRVKKPNRVLVTASNSIVEISAVGYLMGQVDDEYSFSLEGDKLKRIVHLLDETDVLRFRKKDNDKILITYGRSRYNLASLDPENYPYFEAKKSKWSFSIDAKQLRDAVRSVLFCAANNDVRKYLEGVLLEIKGKELIAVATDGHRMAKNTVADIRYEGDDVSCIIPKKSVNELISILDREDEVTLNFSEEQFNLKTSTVNFYSRLIDGRFPDYERVIPKSNDRVLKANKNDFSKLIKMSSLLEGKGSSVIININNQVLQMTSKGDNEESINEMTVDFDGELQMGFNVDYLGQAINDIATDDVDIFLNESGSSPALIKDHQRSMVIMPMRV